MDKTISRRDFLHLIGGGLICLGLSGVNSLLNATNTSTSPSLSIPNTKPKNLNSRVVWLDCREARLAADRFDTNCLREKLDKAVTLLTNTDSAEKGWRALFSNKDVIGLKLNCLAGKGLSTTPELVMAVVESLQKAGIPEENIIIWERFNRELVKAGFKLNYSSKGVKCFGTELDYEEEPTEMGSVGSCLSRIFLRTTAMINMGVVKDHNLAGASIGMKNLYGIIHNPNKYHFNNCNPYVAEISASRQVRQRLRLIIADALWAQCHNGPARDDRYRWQADTVLVGIDPVAVDAVGIDMIEKQRKAMGLKTLAEDGRAPEWLKTAKTMGVGEAELGKIEILRQ